ncbi:MAG: N-acetylmuramoyl-L-alanine amidase [Mycobacteriales bacterium]
MQIYARGDVGPAVAEIRAKLAVHGLLPATRVGDLAVSGGEDASFDADCDHAVRGFQQARGLTVDGVVGPETYRALDEARWRLGDRLLSHTVSHPYAGDDVVELQQRLLDMGFDPGRCDGIFGRRTDGALREFQRNVGLAPDGTCGPTTLRALARLARTVMGGHPQLLRESELLHRAGPALVGKVIVIDPGHGGADRGSSSGGLEEAALVEDLAARLEGRLAATGVRAFLTRGPDTGPTDAARAAFANACEADLLLSLHVDEDRSAQARGLATYYYGNVWSGAPGAASPVGERLAGLLQRELVARTGMADCRAHPKMWDLLRWTRMQAVRVELGYLTSPTDAARLNTPEFRDTVAEAFVVAVQRLYLPPESDADTGSLRMPSVLAV